MNKMNTKNILVSFLAVFVLATLATTVSAGEDYTISSVQLNNVNVDSNSSNPIVVLDASDTVTVEVYFTSHVYDEDVTVDVELKGDDFKVSGETKKFVALENSDIRKVVTLKLPSEIEDKLYDDDVKLTIEISGDDSNEEVPYTLAVKRTDFSVAIKSINTNQRVNAGETIPVDVVLENIGFEDLDDLYVTAGIESLGVMQSAYFGDVVALECDDNDEDEFPWNSSLDRDCDEDDTDSMNGRLYLELPYNAKAGIYTVEVTVKNDDVTETKAVQLVIDNDFESSVFKSGNEIWLVNPTDQVVGYRIVAESPASVSKSIVFVAAGASESVTVEPNAQGEYSFDVSVFSTKGELVNTITFSGSNGVGSDNDSTGTNPVIILTVILAIIFIVLLVVLIVLLGKKPEKSTEFGESYY